MTAVVLPSECKQEELLVGGAGIAQDHLPAVGDVKHLLRMPRWCARNSTTPVLMLKFVVNDLREASSVSGIALQSLILFLRIAHTSLPFCGV